MSVDIAYVQRAVDAALRLALRDTKAITLLDMTADGFYRSFAAMIVAFPLYVVFLAGIIAAGQQLDPKEVEFGASDFVLGSLFYLLLWIAFPVVVLLVLRFLGLTARYSALVIAYNWSAVIVMLLFDIPLVLFGLGLISPFPAAALLFTIFGFALYYRFFLGVASLEAGTSTAMAVAIINVIVFFFSFLVIDGLGGLLST